MQGRIGRNSAKYSQATRLAEMMRILSARAVTVNELAAMLKITRRQVYRDLARIEEDGHPLTHDEADKERLWQLPLGYRGLPPVTLSPYELMSLYFARTSLACLAATSFDDDLERVFLKLTASLPRKTVAHLERVFQIFVPRPKAIRAYSAHKKTIAVLRQALLLQQASVITHASGGKAQPIQYQVHPYCFLLHENGLYLIAYSTEAKGLRKYAVERIRKAEVTTERFEIRKDALDAFLCNRPFGIIDEPPRSVQIRFSQKIAHLVRERTWHPTQKIQSLPGGDVIVSLYAGGLQEIAAWVLSWGPNACALEPPELVHSVRSQLAAAHELYQSSQR